MGIGTWVLIFLGLIVVAVVGLAIVTSKMKKQMEVHVDGLADFTPTQRIMGNNGQTGIAFDEQRKKICLIQHGSNITSRIFNYSDVLACEIFQDGTTITKTLRSSQIGGALIGGLALGGIGALIGGLSGKTKTTDKVSRIDLRIIVNDTAKPLHDVNFLENETKRGGFVFNTAMQQARHWHGIVEVLIKRADMEDKANVPEQPKLPPSSLADELRKLADLRDTGVLSTNEFDAQKARLLA